MVRMEAEVKLTGILSLGALKASENRRHGTVIALGLYAPVQQHLFVAWLDMAVDCKPGEGLNQVVEVNVKVEKPGPNNTHNNAFYAEETLLRIQQEAQRDCNALSARHIGLYVLGITHIPRLQDWPVMPVEHIGFSLMVCVAFHLKLEPLDFTCLSSVTTYSALVYHVANASL